MADRLITFLLASFAVLFQALALRVFFGPPAAQQIFFIEFLAWQNFAALSAAIWLVRLYAFGDRPADKWIFIHAFVVCFFLPVARQILLLGSLLLAIEFSRRQRTARASIRQNATVSDASNTGTHVRSHCTTTKPAKPPRCISRRSHGRDGGDAILTFALDR